MEIELKIGTDFWRFLIEREMKNFMPDVEFHDDDKMPIGYR